MPMTLDTDVLIVGAGPVGLTLALDLGKRGINTTIVEQKPAPQFLPKMERCNARTMEIWRRMGIVDKVRKAGLRADCPMDVFVVLALNEAPLLHLEYPSVDAAREATRNVNDGSLPLEPHQLCSQYTVEPLLKAEVEKFGSVDVRFGHEYISFTQDPAGVTTLVKTLDGKDVSIRARFMVGCDGGASRVRKDLGISLRGEGNLLALRQALYRCDELYDRIPICNGPGHGRHYHVADDKATFLIMQDSTQHWTLHATVETDEEMNRQFEMAVGVPVKYELLSGAPWRQNLLLADRYGQGRVLLAGDAVHLVIPTGGLGMNTGVGDAVDLGWKLAAVLQGWGGPGLITSYEVERRQVGERAIGASRYASTGRRKWRSQWRSNIREQSPEGAATRANLARVADIEQRKTNEMIGADLGYRYVSSPIVMDIPGGPELLFRTYQPTTWPGARLPHVWLDDGTPIQDHIPYEGYTLLKLGRTTADTRGLEAAIKARGAPLAVIETASEAARTVYGFDLLLLRPDMHVAWRGSEPPEAPSHVAGVVTGHEPLF
jgi:2-polyprenyl-6-methoxyphenol hydroxylase-like FAD-dependent oxidoreductase